MKTKPQHPAARLRSALKSTWPHFRRWAGRLAYSPLPPVLLAGSLVLGAYQSNIASVYARSLILPSLEAVVIGLLPYLLFRWLLRTRLAVTTASLLAVPLFFNYEPRLTALGPFVNALMPVKSDATSDLIVIAVLLVACGAVGWATEWTARRLKFPAVKLAQFLIIVVSVVFVANLFKVSVALIRLQPQKQPVKSAIAAQNVAQVSSKPDIYYIVLEDYAYNDTLKDIYHYDNSPFLDFLSTNGFTVPSHTYSNYPYTSDSIPSTLQMDYLVEASSNFKNAQSTEFPMRAVFNNPPLVQALKKQGYQYLHLGSWWTDTRKIPSADVNYSEGFMLHALGLQKTMTEFESTLISQSVFGHFLMNGVKLGGWKMASMTNYGAREVARYQYAALKQIAESPTQGSRFIFGHILMPHPPFAFNADGSSPVYSSDANDDGETLEAKYVAQLRYINTLTQDLVTDIKSHAKQPPVIIIQSDEGPHPREMGDTDSELQVFDLTKLSTQKLDQKYGILAAYDLPGATPEEMSLLNSPVNTFRVVLDHYFGYQLPDLPDCSFAFNQGKHILNFVDITARLRGSEDPRCADIHK